MVLERIELFTLANQLNLRNLLQHQKWHIKFSLETSLTQPEARTIEVIFKRQIQTFRYFASLHHQKLKPKPNGEAKQKQE